MHFLLLVWILPPGLQAQTDRQGQPSAGTNGNVNLISLSESISISWTGMKVVKHDGSQHHGIGIIPNVYVKKTIAGVRSHQDEFLNKAIELANKVN